MFHLLKMVWKQDFLVCPPSGHMARKQCFLVCPPSGHMARKQGFLVCTSSVIFVTRVTIDLDQVRLSKVRREPRKLKRERIETAIIALLGSQLIIILFIICWKSILKTCAVFLCVMSLVIPVEYFRKCSDLLDMFVV